MRLLFRNRLGYIPSLFHLNPARVTRRQGVKHPYTEATIGRKTGQETSQAASAFTGFTSLIHLDRCSTPLRSLIARGLPFRVLIQGIRVDTLQQEPGHNATRYEVYLGSPVG